jgi:threonine synthase
VARGVIDPGQRVVCVLTGHALKDPNVTVGYHTLDAAALGEKYAPYGVASAQFANQPVAVDDDLETIIRAIEENEP